MGRAQPEWFDSKILLLALVLLAALPLALPAIPPLIDLPGHMARYRIALDLHSSPYLHSWFDYRWELFGNLGVDLLIVPMARLFGLELGTKLIVLTIPAMTVGGMLYMAREVHGRVPATAFFALPLAYGYPFQFGFVNFALSMALTFLFIGLWLHLGRLGRYRLRGWLFAILSPALFLAHCIGWAIFGVAVFAIELMRRRQSGASWHEAVWRVTLIMLPLASALLIVLSWWSHGPAGVTAYFPWHNKLYMLLLVLRDRVEIFDVLSALLLYALLLLGARRIGLGFDRGLALAALLVFLAYLATPGILKGVSYGDVRMIPYFLAIAVLGLAPLTHARRWKNAIAIAGLTFFAARMGSQAWTYWILGKHQQEQLAALDHVDRGARLLVMVDMPCGDDLYSPRNMHLGSIATVRRDAYVNGMWSLPTGQLATITYDAAVPFTYSPSQVLRPAHCRDWNNLDLKQALAASRSGAFDYLWLIDAPAARWPAAPWLKRVWNGPRGVLYRIGTTS